MRWTRGDRSEDLEDRRGESPGRGSGLRVGGGIGLGGAVVLLVLSLVFGQNFFALLDGGGELAPAPGGGAPTAPAASARPPRSRPRTSSRSCSTTRRTPGPASSPQHGARRTSDAKLVLFTDATRSGCGVAQTRDGALLLPATIRRSTSTSASTTS